VKIVARSSPRRRPGPDVPAVQQPRGSCVVGSRARADHVLAKLAKHVVKSAAAAVSPRTRTVPRREPARDAAPAGHSVHRAPAGTPDRDIARGGIEAAKRIGRDVVIIDTAGRLTIDDALMDEIRGIDAAVKPVETLLVVDAMTGQEAVTVDQGFAGAVPVTGLVLTKIDGDARGGAALSTAP